LLIHPTGHAAAWQMALTLVAPLCWSLGTMYATLHKSQLRPLVATGLQMVVGGAILLALALAHGEFANLGRLQVSAQSVLALAYLIVFGSMVAYSCYVWVLRQLPTQVVSTYAYVNP